jgi:hypothetical protein
MIIYNVTSQVAPEVHENWLEWMQTHHIPKALDTLYFEEVTILKVGMDQPTDPTYAVQYKASSRRHLQDYLDTEAALLKQEIHEKFGEQVLSFETQLELVSNQS